MTVYRPYLALQMVATLGYFMVSTWLMGGLNSKYGNIMG